MESTHDAAFFHKSKQYVTYNSKNKQLTFKGMAPVVKDKAPLLHIYMSELFTDIFENKGIVNSKKIICSWIDRIKNSKDKFDPEDFILCKKIKKKKQTPSQITKPTLNENVIIIEDDENDNKLKTDLEEEEEEYNAGDQYKKATGHPYTSDSIASCVVIKYGSVVDIRQLIDDGSFFNRDIMWSILDKDWYLNKQILNETSDIFERILSTTDKSDNSQIQLAQEILDLIKDEASHFVDIGRKKKKPKASFTMNQFKKNTLTDIPKGVKIDFDFCLKYALSKQ